MGDIYIYIERERERVMDNKLKNEKTGESKIGGGMGLLSMMMRKRSSRRAASSSFLLQSSVALLVFFSVSYDINVAECGQIVPTLPGFNGTLPFVMETGYISVGEVEFFYYFVESETEPDSDPLMLFVSGGPGCSSLNAFFYQNGPLYFNTTQYKGGLPQLLYSNQAWTQIANIIFLDAPVGTGWSYATTAAGYVTNDTYTSVQLYGFMKNWLDEHPRFLLNPFYLGSDSYSGVYVPMLSQLIINGNEAGVQPRINIKGFSMGCPHTDTYIESNTQVKLAHRYGFVPDQLYQAAYNACDGWFVQIDPFNSKCVETVAAIKRLYADIPEQHILEPNCAFLTPQIESEVAARRSLSESRDSMTSFLSLSGYDSKLECRNFEYLLMSVWANYEEVKEALHIRPGTVKVMQRCNITIKDAYVVDTDNVVAYHRNLTESGLQVLIYSGDHDNVIPHIGIEEWIGTMNLTVDSDWRPWFVDGQIMGYTVKYTNDGYRMTYATVKGAGHSPPEYERRSCYFMFDRWISYYPL